MLNLREIKSDILVLANYFLKRYSNGTIKSVGQILNKKAINALLDYDWPGNVRQLENAMEYLVVIRGKAKDKKLDKMELPEYITDGFIKYEDALLVDILGNKMLWILEKIKDSDGAGRRYLAELANKENISLSEGEIRSLMNKAKSFGFLEAKIGRRGTVLTKKGLTILTTISSGNRLNNYEMGKK